MLELVIDLSYQVPVQERVGLHNVREVLDLAETLDIATLRDHCLQLLGKHLELENCVGTYQLALNILSSDAFRYILRNFDKVWATNSEFESLTPDERMSVLHDDELHAPNEVECAFGAILKWIAGKVENRRGHLPRLLSLIRFAFCSRADMEKVESDPLVRASEQALEVLCREADAEPGAGWSDSATNHLLTYNCRSSRWLLQPSQNTRPRAYHGVAMLNGLIYFVGGFNGRLKAVVHEDMIYVLGGTDVASRLETAERLDVRRGHWS
ncbi:kelch-like protein 10 [Haemaphysalis longicornis]